MRSSGLCRLHFKDEDFTNEGKTRLRRNCIPVHWQRVQEEVVPHQEQANRLAEVAVQEEVVPHEEPANQPAEDALQLEEVSEEQSMCVETHEPPPVVIQRVCANDTVEQQQQETENECIGMVRPLPSSTYPSGREMFSFLDEDVDLSFLNYEPCAKTPDVNVASKNKDSVPTASPLRPCVKTPDVNVASKNKDSVPTALPLRKRVSVSTRSKLEMSKLQSQLLAEQTKVKQLQRVTKTQRNKIRRLTKRLKESKEKASLTIVDFLETEEL